MKKVLSFRVLMIVLVAVLALLVKYLYLHTAESAADIEELNLVPLKAIAHGAGRVDIAHTRLYNFKYITNYIFLYIFGYNLAALKLTSLAFFFVACVAIYNISAFWCSKLPAWIKYLPVVLFAFGPPVAQMWALKNRGGFIETIALFAVIVWCYQRWFRSESRSELVYVLGMLCGVALWAHPIALAFVVPAFIGVCWESLNGGVKSALVTSVKLGVSTVIGVMPLIALNFLYDFNTFRVVGGGEGGVGAPTSITRFSRLFSGGIPRLLGLKQQWSDAWVLGSVLSYLVLALFLLAIIVASISLLRRIAGERRYDEVAVLIFSMLLVLAGNIFTSWGSFQEEPRRLLLLYIPFLLLVTKAFVDRPMVLILFCSVWLSVSAISNFQYVRANMHGFNSVMYRSYKPLTDFLQAHDIDHVYVNVWEGNKISFESHMRISWSANPYMRSSSGYYSDNSFSSHDAAVFYKSQPGGLEAANKMRSDLDAAGIQCVEADKDSFIVLYACSKIFDISNLSKAARQLEQFQADGVIFNWNTYHTGSLAGFYAKESAMVWTRPDVELMVNISNDSGEYLCLVAGKQRSITSENLDVLLDGSLVEMRASFSDEKESAFTSSVLSAGAPGRRLTIAIDPFVPARNGSGDSRALGLPLNQVRFVRDTNSCR